MKQPEQADGRYPRRSQIGGASTCSLHKVHTKLSLLPARILISQVIVKHPCNLFHAYSVGMPWRRSPKQHAPIMARHPRLLTSDCVAQTMLSDGENTAPILALRSFGVYSLEHSGFLLSCSSLFRVQRTIDFGAIIGTDQSEVFNKDDTRSRRSGPDLRYHISKARDEFRFACSLVTQAALEQLR